MRASVVLQVCALEDHFNMALAGLRTLATARRLRVSPAAIAVGLHSQRYGARHGTMNAWTTRAASSLNLHIEFCEK